MKIILIAKYSVSTYVGHIDNILYKGITKAYFQNIEMQHAYQVPELICPKVLH